MCKFKNEFEFIILYNISKMSAQALNELKALEVTLESISAGVPSGLSEAGLQTNASAASSILSSTPLDPKNPWRDYLLIQKLMKTAIIPTKNNDLDAGYDLYAFDSVVIPPWGKALVSTQISIAVPPGTYGRIASRSGLSVKNDLEVGAGVIDRGYTGEVKVVLRNFSDNEYRVERGDKIAQLILENCKQCPVKEVKNISEIVGHSTRGSLGFGSSGK
jgi:dUTP pyrophosphatase